MRCVHDYLPRVVAEHSQPLDLSPLPKGVLARALAQMTDEERAEEAQLARASARPKPGDWA